MSKRGFYRVLPFVLMFVALVIPLFAQDHPPPVCSSETQSDQSIPCEAKSRISFGEAHLAEPIVPLEGFGDSIHQIAADTDRYMVWYNSFAPNYTQTINDVQFLLVGIFPNSTDYGWSIIESESGSCQIVSALEASCDFGQVPTGTLVRIDYLIRFPAGTTQFELQIDYPDSSSIVDGAATIFIRQPNETQVNFDWYWFSNTNNFGYLNNITYVINPNRGNPQGSTATFTSVTTDIGSCTTNTTVKITCNHGSAVPFSSIAQTEFQVAYGLDVNWFTVEVDQDGLPEKDYYIRLFTNKPYAFDDNFTTEFNTSLSVPVAEGVLFNDFDYDGDPIFASLVSGPSHAREFNLAADGSFTYVPVVDYSGQDSFTYHATDGVQLSSLTTVSITVNEASVPGSQPPGLPRGFVIEPNQGRPTISWEFDRHAQVFEIWIGTKDYATEYQSWLYRPDAPGANTATNHVNCAGLTCTIKPDINLPGGTHQLWMQAWGYGAFSTGGTLDTAPSWNGPYAFSLPTQKPQAVTNMNASVATDGQTTLTWNGAQNATWYNLWVGTDGDANPPWQPRFFNWILAENIGCENAGVCTLQPGSELVDGSKFSLDLNTGEYVWYVQSWGPGGFSTGGVPGAEAFAQGPNIVVP